MLLCTCFVILCLDNESSISADYLLVDGVLEVRETDEKTDFLGAWKLDKYLASKSVFFGATKHKITEAEVETIFVVLVQMIQVITSEGLLVSHELSMYDLKVGEQFLRIVHDGCARHEPSMCRLECSDRFVAFACAVLHTMTFVYDESVEMDLMQQAFVVLEVLLPPLLLLCGRLLIFWVVCEWIRFDHFLVSGDTRHASATWVFRRGLDLHDIVAP